MSQPFTSCACWRRWRIDAQPPTAATITVRKTHVCGLSRMAFSEDIADANRVRSVTIGRRGQTHRPLKRRSAPGTGHPYYLPAFDPTIQPATAPMLLVESHHVGSQTHAPGFTTPPGVAPAYPY